MVADQTTPERVGAHPESDSLLRPWWWNYGSLAGPIVGILAGVLFAVGGFAGWGDGKRQWGIVIVGLAWSGLLAAIVVGTRLMAPRIDGVSSQELAQPRRGDLTAGIVFSLVIMAVGVWAAFFSDWNERGPRTGLPLPILGWVGLTCGAALLANTVRLHRKRRG